MTIPVTRPGAITTATLGFFLLVIAVSQPAMAQDEFADDANNIPSVESQASNTENSGTDNDNSISNDNEIPERTIPIEQITVTGQRSFFLLRAQIEDAKKALYSNYNELNMDDEFDVTCKQQAWTGTYITELQCWPAFFERAVADNAQDFLRGNAVPEPVRQLQAQYAPEFDELRANILSVANENPSVRESLLDLGELEEAYNRKREECMAQPAFLLIFRLC